MGGEVGGTSAGDMMKSASVYCSIGRMESSAAVSLRAGAVGGGSAASRLKAW